MSAPTMDTGREDTPSSPVREVEGTTTSSLTQYDAMAITPTHCTNRLTTTDLDSHGEESVDVDSPTPASASGQTSKTFQVPSAGSTSASSGVDSQSPTSYVSWPDVPLMRGPPSVGDRPSGSPPGSPHGSIRTVMSAENAAGARSDGSPSVYSSFRSWATTYPPDSEPDLENQTLIQSVEDQHSYGSFPPIESYDYVDDSVELILAAICILVVFAIIIGSIVQGILNR
ncbi:hypothetical protein GGS26DRAFT_594227 [Hypomontagnella submonticulosa]|nr:hypothetical protein GGS26DRAFT_594227 [Hypomontagnella submonticulosa]